MIEYKYKDPSALGNGSWLSLSQYAKEHELNFARFVYKINDVVYEKHTDEFHIAFEQVVFWRQLTKPRK